MPRGQTTFVEGSYPNKNKYKREFNGSNTIHFCQHCFNTAYLEHKGERTWIYRCSGCSRTTRLPVPTTGRKRGGKKKPIKKDGVDQTSQL